MNFNGYIILYGKHKKFHEHEITIIIIGLKIIIIIIEAIKYKYDFDTILIISKEIKDINASFIFNLFIFLF